MPSYKPITKPEELPKPGEDVEHETLDFKARYDLSKSETRHELAKDLAMFANHLGGTVLVGAAEDRTTKRLRAWAPLTAADAGQLKDAAEQCLDHLSPRPLLAVERFTVPDGEVVALNVEATVGGAIGVRQPGHRDAWTFPIRRASQCAFLSPEVLSMYMMPEFRRITVMLGRIKGHPLTLRHWVTPIYAGKASPQRREVWNPLKGKVIVVAVHPENNCVFFRDDSGSQVETRAVPIDEVESVFIESSGDLEGGSIKEGTRIVVLLKKRPDF